MENFLDKTVEMLQVGGVDFRGYRNKFLTEQIAGRMAFLEIDDPAEYLDRLRADPLECDRLINVLLIQVSSFFRNPIVFEIIAQRILPQIIERSRRAGTNQIRVWSAGCARGEEAYSIAILIYEAIRDQKGEWWPYIFATDISQNALKSASMGMYPRESFKNTKLSIFDKYFISRDDVYCVNPSIREMVRFSQDSLTSKERFAPAESVFGTFDLVLCRNVLIYFSSKFQKRIIEKLYKSLNKGGFLILGDSEYFDEETERRLISIDFRNRIFQKPE